VEFALVLPILLALVFGVITWGFIFAAQISLTSSARDAARAGVVHSLAGTGLDCSTIAASARSGSTTLGVVPIQVGVIVTSPDGTSCTLPKNSATVTSNGTKQMCLGTSGQLVVSLQYTAVSPVPFALPSSAALSAIGAFQCEYS